MSFKIIFIELKRDFYILIYRGQVFTDFHVLYFHLGVDFETVAMHGLVRFFCPLAAEMTCTISENIVCCADWPKVQDLWVWLPGCSETSNKNAAKQHNSAFNDASSTGMHHVNELNIAPIVTFISIVSALLHLALQLGVSIFQRPNYPRCTAPKPSPLSLSVPRVQRGLCRVY